MTGKDFGVISYHGVPELDMTQENVRTISFAADRVTNNELRQQLLQIARLPSDA